MYIFNIIFRQIRLGLRTLCGNQRVYLRAYIWPTGGLLNRPALYGHLDWTPHRWEAVSVTLCLLSPQWSDGISRTSRSVALHRRIFVLLFHRRKDESTFAEEILNQILKTLHEFKVMLKLLRHSLFSYNCAPFIISVCIWPRENKKKTYCTLHARVLSPSVEKWQMLLNWLNFSHFCFLRSVGYGSHLE